MVNMISIILQDVVAENIKPESKNEEIPGWMWWKTWRSPMKWRWNDWRTWWNPIWDIPGYRWMKPDENMTKCWRPLSSGMKVRKYKMKKMISYVRSQTEWRMYFNSPPQLLLHEWAWEWCRPSMSRDVAQKWGEQVT